MWGNSLTSGCGDSQGESAGSKGGDQSRSGQLWRDRPVLADSDTPRCTTSTWGSPTPHPPWAPSGSSSPGPTRAGRASLLAGRRSAAYRSDRKAGMALIIGCTDLWRHGDWSGGLPCPQHMGSECHQVEETPLTVILPPPSASSLCWCGCPPPPPPPPPPPLRPLRPPPTC